MTNLTRSKRQKYAKIMREFAKEYLADGLATWRDEDDMISMVREDARDFREIAKLIRAGKIDEAGRKAQSLDTAPRECIPDIVWDNIIGDGF